MKKLQKLECGTTPNVMAALMNIGGALFSMPQSFLYWKLTLEMIIHFRISETRLLFC